MRPAVGAGVLLVAPLAAGAVLLVPAHAREAAVRVVDQTYSCSVKAQARVAKIQLEGKRGFRDEGAWKWHPSAEIRSWGGPAATLPPDRQGISWTSTLNWSFSAAGGDGPARSDPGAPTLQPGLAVTPRRACVRTTARVPLSPRGLQDIGVGYFADHWECKVGAKVLVRVRGVYAEPASFRVDPSRGELRTRTAAGAVREAHIAVRTPDGQPLVYARVAGSGAARIHTGRGCTAR